MSRGWKRHGTKALAEASFQRSYKGTFNVRGSPDLHKRAVRKSISEGISLNRLVRRALEKEVGMN